MFWFLSSRIRFGRKDVSLEFLWSERRFVLLSMLEARRNGAILRRKKETCGGKIK